MCIFDAPYLPWRAILLYHRYTYRHAYRRRFSTLRFLKGLLVRLQRSFLLCYSPLVLSSYAIPFLMSFTANSYNCSNNQRYKPQPSETRANNVIFFNSTYRFFSYRIGVIKPHGFSIFKCQPKIQTDALHTDAQVTVCSGGKRVRMVWCFPSRKSFSTISSRKFKLFSSAIAVVYRARQAFTKNLMDRLTLLHERCSCTVCPGSHGKVYSGVRTTCIILACPSAGWYHDSTY